MPRYVLIDEGGERSERHLSLEEFDLALQPDFRLLIEGTLYEVDIRSVQTRGTSGAFPQHCSALGVGSSPGARRRLYEDSVKLGVPTVPDRRGDPVFESRRHRNKYLAAMGHRDNDAGYGDHAGSRG